MNMKKVLFLAIVAIFPCIAADAQKGGEVKDAMKKLQGVWQVTKWVDSSGELAPPDEIKDMTFEFKEDRMVKSGQQETLKYTLNPKNPTWIDIDLGVMISEGIYQLQGDELKICLISGSRSGQAPERPTEFKANQKKHHTLFVMKKIKK